MDQALGDQALGPLQYGDASPPQHKVPPEEPSQKPEESAQKPEEPAQQQAIVLLKQVVVPQVPTIMEAAISTPTKVLRRAFRSKDCVQVLHSARG